MKKVTLFLMAFVVAFSVSAQKVTKDHYTVSGGFLGGANFSKFRLDGSSSGLSYDFTPGWSAGAWLNIPFGKAVSFEPQVMYSQYGYSPNVATAGQLDGSMTFINVPVQLKFHLWSWFALTAGAQFDFLNDVNDDNNVVVKDDILKTSTSLIGGVELFPHSRFTIYGRYGYGLSNMDDSGNPNTAIKYYNDNIQVGLKLKLFGKHILADSDGDGVVDKDDKCPDVAGLAKYEGCPIPDTDGDGVNDELDKCPNQPGLAKYDGCPPPDRDGDGINDDEDKCPDVAGVAKYNGCPVPDTDGDGVNDEMDKCPNQPGLAKYDGCPAPDRDGDGVADDDDKCPDVAGVASNNGCPEYSITFATGKSVLTAEGKKALDEVAKEMNANPNMTINFVGNTDNTGTDKINNPLSVARAKSCQKYLVSKGIKEDRIATDGKGSTQPIDTNETPEGRQKNRRVDISVK